MKKDERYVEKYSQIAKYMNITLYHNIIASEYNQSNATIALEMIFHAVNNLHKYKNLLIKQVVHAVHSSIVTELLI